MNRLALLSAVVVVSSSCATMSDAPQAEFKPIGEISFPEHSSAFSEDRVTSPTMNASRRSDQSWGGRFLQGPVNTPIDVNLHGNALKGVDLIVSWEEKPNGVVIDAQVQGRILHFEVDDQKWIVRTATRQGVGGQPLSFTIPRADKENFAGGGKLTGAASEVHPPEPAFALAMLAAFD